MKLHEINTNTKEGKLLFAALVILTQNNYVVGHETVYGSSQTPNQTLARLESLSEFIERKD